MSSGGNNLRDPNAQYWLDILEKMQDPNGQFDDELIVVPTPVNFCIENEPPSEPSEPHVDIIGNTVTLSAAPSIDPDGDSITYDVYRGQEGGALLIVTSDSNDPVASVNDLPPDKYIWRVVAKDCRGGLKYGPIWSFCFCIEAARNPRPADGATDVSPLVELSWTAGVDANSHDVYFGSSFAEVNDANTSSAAYQANQLLSDVNYGPGLLEFDTTYYWRIDEVNDSHPNSPWKGCVWRFTTAEYIVVDDFESYASTGELRLVWDDGLANGTDSDIFLEADANFTRDGNSMRYQYTNDTMKTGKAIGSAVDADPIDLESGRDWTAGGVKALVLYFLGDPCTVISELGSVWPWVELEDTSSNAGWVMYPDPNHVTEPTWHEWNIDLSIFDACGVALSSIERLTIGIGGSRVGQTSKATTTSKLWIDDIRLYPTRCRPELAVTDLTDDCITDYADLRIILEEWLSSGIEADIVDDDNVNFLDYGLLADNWLAEDLWP
jgi:hypothetical protein